MKKEKPSVIDTSRLCLRSITDADAKAVVSILTNREVGKTFMLPDYAAPEEALKTFEGLKQRSYSVERFVYGIYHEQELIGFLNDVEQDEESVELGIVLHPRYHNKGFATEALSAAMEALFAMGYAVVKTGVFEENAPSARVMEKCGMEKQDYVDQIEYRGNMHRCIWFEKKRPQP